MQETTSIRLVGDHGLGNDYVTPCDVLLLFYSSRKKSP